MSTLPIKPQSTLFGGAQPVERAGVNRDPRTIVPFTVELERELARAEAIRRDPFKYLRRTTDGGLRP